MTQQSVREMALKAAVYIVVQREAASKIQDEIDRLSPLIESDIDIDVKVVRLRISLMEMSKKIQVAIYDLSMMAELIGVPISEFLGDDREDVTDE